MEASSLNTPKDLMQSLDSLEWCHVISRNAFETINSPIKVHVPFDGVVKHLKLWNVPYKYIVSIGNANTGWLDF